MKHLPRIGAAIAFALMALVAYLWWGPGPAKTNVRVTIPEGARLESATNYLFYAGAISGPRVKFYYFARLLGEGDPIQAGEFEIPARASPAKVLDIIQHGRPVVRLVTIPEGMPSVLVHEKVAAVPHLTGDAPLPPEGTVLPSSYDYQRGEDRAALIRRMQAAMTKTLDGLWAKRKPACPISSKVEAVILASIVEKETGKASERRLVAGVYSNRLRQNMPLQADPTVIYPVTQGRPLGRRILLSELRARNGYNTYVIRGLPEGPIANPGRASIAAVLDPQPTPHLYFVADGTGGHVFATTLAEHEANVERWRALRRSRGEIP